MRVTNKNNLPEVLVNAIEKMIYPPSKGMSMGATTLISPPIIHQLRKRHWEELEEDVTDSTWRFLGTAIHKVLEGVSDSNIAEVRAGKEIEGMTIRCVADVKEGSELYDYKVTSSWKKTFSKGTPPEWARQLNINAYLFRDIKTAKIIAIYRDWSAMKALGNPDYPQTAIEAYSITLAPAEEQLKYITERIRLHKAAMELPDDQLPICTPEERWAKETVWAVYKNTNKTATKLFKKLDEATTFAMKMGEQFPKATFHFVERKGEDTRCKRFCPVARWCEHGKNLLKGGE